MLRDLSEEVRVNLKDRLRDLRVTLRQHRHDGMGTGPGTPDPVFPLREIEGLIGHAASAVDDLISIAGSLVPGRSAGAEGVAPSGLLAWFPAGGTSASGERAFRHDVYALIKAVLAHRKVEGAVVHESRLASAHGALRGRHASRLAALHRGAGPESGRIASIAAVCGPLLRILLEQDPIRFPALPDARSAVPAHDRDLPLRCLAPVVLASGLATLSAGAGSEVMEVALLGAEARHDRLLEAVARDDQDRELIALFETLLAHLL